jgi:hypothetical protein
VADDFEPIADHAVECLRCGTAVSSGCFRLVNTDVADLYERVPVGTKVIIRQKPEL